MNSDRVRWTPVPTETEVPNARNELKATTEDVARKNHQGDTWFVKEVRDHRGSEDAVDFEVEWKEDYAPTWEPGETLPEEIISGQLKRHRAANQKKAVR